MAKQTKPILDMINDCLLDMGRGFVNDLGQTPEADRVENIYKSVYYQFLQNKLWPNKRQLVNLESLADLTRRTFLRVPEGVTKVDKISYNIGTSTDPIWRELTFYEPEKARRMFMDRVLGDAGNTTLVDVDGTDLVVYNDNHPTWWTSFDDEYIVLDSYKQSVEDTVQGYKASAWAYVEPVWPQTKNDCVDIPERFVSAYEAKAKAVCYEKIKKEPSGSDVYFANKAINRLQHEERINGREDAIPRKRYGKRRPY